MGDAKETSSTTAKVSEGMGDFVLYMLREK
jgi:hypothetical protein